MKSEIDFKLLDEITDLSGPIDRVILNECQLIKVFKKMIIRFYDSELVLDEQWEPLSFVFENGEEFTFTPNTTSIEKHIELIRHALSIKEPIKGMLKFAFKDEMEYEIEIPKYFIDNLVL